jgi:hypothetical protein
MKVAVITLHAALNFGSALQTYALCQVVQELGHRVEVIDFVRPTHHGWALAKRRYLNGPGGPAARLRNMLGLSIEARNARRRFDAFLQARTTLTARRFGHIRELVARPPIADVYLTGSDQVWNSNYNGGVEPAFYLAFAPLPASRVSYAASFGVDALPPAEHDATRSFLERYDAVSVREASGLRILHQLGVAGTRVLDPTLLLSAEQWAQQAAAPMGGRDYVLVYSVEEERVDAVMRVARAEADARGLPVYQVTFGGRRRRFPGADRTFHFSTPDQFLGLFAAASFVVSSSFHGTVFSLIFRKQFYSISPPLYGGRTGELLDSLHLGQRFLSPSTPVDPFALPIEYEAVHTLLAEQIADSKAFLARALSATFP